MPAPLLRPDRLSALRAETFAFAAEQYTGMLGQLKSTGKFPRTWTNGKRVLVGAPDWTSGFFPGALWYLFEATGERRWREAAEVWTAGLEAMKENRRTHDVGFMLHCSFGNGYRLTGNPRYADVLVRGAESLATRFSPTVGCIKSWDTRAEWRYPVIIDNLMNLELLLDATRISGDPRYRDIALRHADTTLQNHFRPNASCYHVVDYDPATGAVRKRQTHQGAADESSWARGQAWAVYGYTTLYRDTGARQYLDQAVRVAEFILTHPRLPADKVPYWDFDAVAIPHAPRDASAAAILASALIELSGFAGPELSARYRDTALEQLRVLASPAYRSPLGANGGFLLQHSTGSFPRASEVDVPLNYADYYFLEALVRSAKGSAGASD